MVGGGSERLLSPNPTTVMVVLFLVLWLLLGCDNKYTEYCHAVGKYPLLPSTKIQKMEKCS